jgi:hypothetical protein
MLLVLNNLKVATKLALLSGSANFSIKEEAPTMSDDAKQQLIEFAKLIVSRAERVASEEAAKQYLILPFFQFLGYDPLNPDEVIPEAHASFSDKFKNRVDYAICIEGAPVIAVECKKTGSLNGANRGELKGYFNAVPTTKLGILTDGLIFELYSDTDLENMMDDKPFVRIDLSSIAKERINDNALDALQKLRKGTFDPADVGADAKRKIFVARYVDVLESQLTSPNEDLVKMFMDAAQVEGRRTSRLIEEHAPIVKEAIQNFVDKKILERVGFANRQDIVKMQEPRPSKQSASADPELSTAEAGGNGVITTETELAIFDHVRSRLSYLVKDDDLFQKVQEISHKDYKTVFTVSYKQERRGKIFNFREGPAGEYRFEFPDLAEHIETHDLRDIDKPLLRNFLARVEELG